MLGAIAGDIIGSVYEGKKQWLTARTADFQPLFSPKARFTDDTVLSVAVADALLHGGDLTELLKDYYARRTRTFAHRFGEFVILNVTLWTWMLVGMGRGVAVQVAIWVCGSLAMLAWEYLANQLHKREFRLAQGLCASCGYDLQESGVRCPECGTAVPMGHRTRSGVASDLKQVR